MNVRKTARAVMLGPDERVLLFEFVIPKDYIAGCPERFWATPGGEIEPGEDVRDAVAREAWEETGIEGFEVGSELWFGSNELLVNGRPTRTVGRFFFVRSPTSALGATNWTDVEKQIMRSHRWWKVAE